MFYDEIFFSMTHIKYIFSHQTILAKIDIRRFAELLQFSPGDHVLLYPENTKKQVQQLIASLKDVPSENTPITIERRTQCHGSTAGNFSKYSLNFH